MTPLPPFSRWILLGMLAGTVIAGTSCSKSDNAQQQTGLSGSAGASASAGSGGTAASAGSSGQGAHAGQGGSAGGTAGAGGASTGGSSGGAAGMSTGGSGPGPMCHPGRMGCQDKQHVARCTPKGTGWISPVECPVGSTCDNGGCVGEIDWHLSASVDLQLIQGRPASELNNCASSYKTDLAAGRLACDALHAVSVLKPRFALFLGNSWTQFKRDDNDPCKTSPDAWRGCIRENLTAIISKLHEVAPNMLPAAHLAEYVHQDNACPSSWPGMCASGTMGRWGANTCVPDIAHSTDAVTYQVKWGKVFLDAGIRAFVIGQARLQGGGVQGSSAVSPAGAAGIASIASQLRTYAASRGISKIYIGIQAASSAVSGGKEQAQFVTGAQHLEPLGTYLIQPLSPKGPFYQGHYGPDDWHDANHENNANQLPVLLDYDNWSSDPKRPDDIRYLAMVDTDQARRRVFENHARHLHQYNTHAYLSVPVSKTLGNNTGIHCQGVNQWHFSANACGITAAAYSVFNHPDKRLTADAGSTKPPIERGYWGQQLRQRDDVAVWVYHAMFEHCPTMTEYQTAVKNMPGMVNVPDGPRIDLVRSLLTNQEISNLTDTEFVTRLYRALLLREPDSAGLAFWVNELKSRTRSDILASFVDNDEARGLYKAP